MRTLGLALWVAMALALGGGDAVAQDVDARAEFERGQTAYQQGDYETALAAFQRAYEADPRPLMLYNIGQAQERLGQLDEAVATFERYLEQASPGDRHQGDARARLASIRERLGRTGIVVTGAPDGAEILVDDQSWGRTPRPDAIRVEPGSHRVVLQADGYERFQAVVGVPVGETVTVEAVMTEAAGGTTGGGTPGGGTTGGGTTGGGSTVEPGGGGSMLPYLLMAGGGALVIGGTVLGVLALGSADSAQTQNDDDADTARGLALGADILLAGGVIAAGVGLALLVIDSGGSQERGPGDVALDVHPVVGPTEAGAALTGSF